MRTFLLAGLLMLCPVASMAEATAPSPEQLELFKQLPPDQQAKLLEQYGLDASILDDDGAPSRDSSNPESVLPRDPAVTERHLAPELEGAESPGSGERGIQRAFANFLEGAQSLSVDETLKPFGYELFAGAPSTFAPATDVPVGPDYVIGPGDEIHVQLYGKSNSSADLTVDRDGLINFPELGPIAVTGLSFRELKETLLREVDKRMIGVEASITMGRLRSIRIFVLGEVFRPGSYSVSGLSTLTNALFASGGVREIGSLRQVQLKRAGELVGELDLYDLLIKGDTSGDARLMPGDVIFVPPVGPMVGAAGEVKRPAIYELKGEFSAAQLLELAGGLTARAHREQLQLDRYEDGERISLDFPVTGASELLLGDGDLLKVYPVTGREEGVVWLEGNVLRPGKRQFREGMRLLDLIGGAEDLLPETHFAYGLIERENTVNRETEYLSFNLEAALLRGEAAENLLLRGRDRVFVFHRAYFREPPRVAVRGEVQTPGRYQYKREMRVLDLLLAAGGLTHDVWLDEAELFRTDPKDMSVTRIALDLAAVLAGDPAANILLADRDELALHSIWEFKRKHEVRVLGQVHQPGVFPLFEGMRVSDLIFAGGNLRENAYLREAELTRYEIVNGEKRVLDHFAVDLAGLLREGGAADLLLQPYDQLLIRPISNWHAHEAVTVSGHVAFPGRYPIEEGERLSDLIERFGGFLGEAYLPAVVFTRAAVRGLQQEQFDRMAVQLEADLARQSVAVKPGESTEEVARREMALEAGGQLAAELKATRATGRLVIHLDSAEALRGTEFDLVLRDGDHIHLPLIPDYVIVMGQVHNPTAFQFTSGNKAKDYINLAGGETRFADGKRVYVVRAGGMVEAGSGSRVQAGDVVIVPENLERFSGMQFMLDLSQVLYQLGIAAASAKTVGAFN